MPAQKPIPPLAAVQSYTRKYPSIWDTIDYLLDAVKDDSNAQWDRSVCLCPISAAYAACTQYGDNYFTMPAPSDVTAMYTWRREKLIYKFDDDLASELMDTADDIVVPVEILAHLPAKCVYIDLPESIKQKYLDGFFAFIEHDVNTHKKELRINPIDANGEFSAFYALHLAPGATIGEGIEESFDFAYKQAEKVKEKIKERRLDVADKINEDFFIEEMKKAKPFIEFCVQLLLYICADNAEMEENPNQKSIYRPMSRIRDQFKEVRQWDVGVKIGASLRKAKSHSTPAQESDMPPLNRKFKNRPHIRRAHWHHFWTGSKDSQKLVLRWVSSIAVNAEDGDIIPTVIEEKEDQK